MFNVQVVIFGTRDIRAYNVLYSSHIIGTFRHCNRPPIADHVWRAAINLLQNVLIITRISSNLKVFDSKSKPAYRDLEIERCARAGLVVRVGGKS